MLFPFSTPNLVTVFISWMNMEVGFDTCFFERMDTYWKTWLQLAFPILCVILLVIIVITISEHSTRLSWIILVKKKSSSNSRYAHPALICKTPSHNHYNTFIYYTTLS